MGLLLAYTLFEAVYLPPVHITINNRNASNVDVVTRWRSRELIIMLRPGATIRLTVDDETGIQFIARHPDGSTIAAEPRYMTEGMRFVVTVDADQVDIESGFR